MVTSRARSSMENSGLPRAAFVPCSEERLLRDVRAPPAKGSRQVLQSGTGGNAMMRAIFADARGQPSGRRRWSRARAATASACVWRRGLGRISSDSVGTPAPPSFSQRSTAVCDCAATRRASSERAGGSTSGGCMASRIRASFSAPLARTASAVPRSDKSRVSVAPGFSVTEVRGLDPQRGNLVSPRTASRRAELARAPSAFACRLPSPAICCSYHPAAAAHSA